MILKFVCPTSKDPPITVEDFTRLTVVDDIRKEVSHLFKFTSKEIRLICRGKELVDGCTLYEYGVKDGDLFYVSENQKVLKTDINCNESAASSRKRTFFLFFKTNVRV